VALKAVASLRSGQHQGGVPLPAWTRGFSYALIAALCAWGAWIVGFDVAAEAYYWGGQNYLNGRQFAKAYADTLRAVQLRPGSLRYWQLLATIKTYAHQFESTLDDLPAFQKLSGGHLDEGDEYRFALCHYYLGHYDQVIQMTEHLIGQNREYAAPYILLGLSRMNTKNYAEAEATFLDVLQLYPNNGAAVEGLAQVYFLEGDRGRAVKVLDQTAKFSFPPEARKRFEALKGLYGQ
jgi:tetratricopeptide (TPR) repeat protein